MATNNNRSDKLDTYLSIVIFFASSLVLADYGTRLYVSVLQVDLPPRIIAGFTEPVTTKLVPGIVVVYVHRRYDISLSHLQTHPYWFAFLGGLSLGVFERSLYIAVREASVSPVFLVAPWMHVLNAVLIAGFVFRLADRLQGIRFFAQLIMVTILGMAIHVFWNTSGVVFVDQLFR